MLQKDSSQDNIIITESSVKFELGKGSNIKRIGSYIVQLNIDDYIFVIWSYL